MKIPITGQQESATEKPVIKNDNQPDVIIYTGNVNEKETGEFVNDHQYGIFALNLLLYQ